MAAEAEKLISLSLIKIAQSRTQKGGVSLHRNLLVATVLQRAQFVYMEESYHMVQQPQVDSNPSIMSGGHQPQDFQNNPLNFDVSGHIASEVVLDEDGDSAVSDQQLFIVREDGNKENHSPSSLSVETSSASVETESRLRDDSSILREKLEGNSSSQIGPVSHSSESTVPRTYTSPLSPASLKRRRAVVAEWETEEAILSILPKKAKKEEDENDECEDSVFHDDALTTLPDTRTTTEDLGDNEVTSMEIDRITSLVSIFSFGSLTGNGRNSDVFSGSVVVGNSPESVGKLTKSVSTPDLCSAQAKESGVDVMQRTYLAMTV